MVQKQQKPRDVLVEVGFGKGWRLGELSGKHSDTVYIGVEIPREAGRIDALKPNVLLEYDGGLAGLQRLPNESVSRIFMDLVLEEDFTLTGPELRKSFPGQGVEGFLEGHTELKYSDIPSRYADATFGKFQFWKVEMLKQIKRVLKPEGTLEINTPKGDLKDVEQLLGNAGFTYESNPATNEEISKSWHKVY